MDGVGAREYSSIRIDSGSGWCDGRRDRNMKFLGIGTGSGAEESKRLSNFELLGGTRVNHAEGLREDGETS